MTSSTEVCCPLCKSTAVQALKKGFGAGKAVGGALVAGPVGLLAGFIGSKKVQIVCLKCGHIWAPSPPEQKSPVAKSRTPGHTSVVAVVAVRVLMFEIGLLFFFAGLYTIFTDFSIAALLIPLLIGLPILAFSTLVGRAELRPWTVVDVTKLLVANLAVIFFLYYTR